MNDNYLEVYTSFFGSLEPNSIIGGERPEGTTGMLDSESATKKVTPKSIFREDNPGSSRSKIAELDEIRNIESIEGTLNEVLDNIPISEVEREILQLPFLYVDDPDIREESQLFISLSRLIIRYGNTALWMISHLFQNTALSPYIAREILSCIGDIRHSPTHENRMWFLGSNLVSPSKILRNGAILGIANMDDPRALGYLKKALERETDQITKKFLVKAINQLEKKMQ